MANHKKYNSENPHIRFQTVHEWLHEQISAIAANKGESIADYLRPKLRDIISQYPEELRHKVNSTKKKEIVFYEASKILSKELDKLTKNFGNKNTFLMVHLFQIIMSEPEKLRKR